MYYKLAINYCTLYSWKYLKLGSFVSTMTIILPITILWDITTTWEGLFSTN